MKNLEIGRVSKILVDINFLHILLKLGFIFGLMHLRFV